MTDTREPSSLGEDLRSGDRRALSRAITLVESMRSADRTQAEALLTQLLPHTGRSMRIGISGAPGVGKSTFIEAFGALVTSEGHRLAVLAVDPSSRRSGGSILGDKTRMQTLARNPHAFIRPSPAGETLGGVARRTREAMLVTEAAGFDVVLVETVGVGQSETAVSEMVDLFVLLVAPGGGDELQGIKRGVMELADLLLVTKGDGELAQPAARAAADYAHALHLMRPKYARLSARVLQVSAFENRGISDAWGAMRELHERLSVSGDLARLREAQLRHWFWNEVHALLLDDVLSGDPFARQAAAAERDVIERKSLPGPAARMLLRQWRQRGGRAERESD